MLEKKAKISELQIFLLRYKELMFLIKKLSTYSDNTCEPYDCYTETDCYTGKFFCSTLTDQGYSCK